MNHTRTRIKVCGITRTSDAQAAVQLGVDAIGMILHAESPRAITTQAAQTIRSVVPAFVSLVGVFVNADQEFIEQSCQQIGLDLIQLHGDESSEFATQLDRPFLKAIRVKDKQQVIAQANDFLGSRALLLDPYVKGVHGGTGQVLDTAMWPNAEVQQPLILAGGLSPDNVYQRVTELQPFAVDLNSGVEQAPGIKSPSLIASAVKEVIRADLARNVSDSTS